MAASSDYLPVGHAPKALPVSHFPSRLHAVIWRNWDSVPLARLAAALKATPAQLRQIAESMGLPPARDIPASELHWNFTSVVRRNWHLLPYEQIAQLLEWDTKTFHYHLMEDDGMWVKLGGSKPQCEAVYYAEPSASEAAAAGRIASIIRSELGDALARPGEAPFQFGERFNQEMPSVVPPGGDEQFALRMVYPYSIRFGDPLIGRDTEDISDGYLKQLVASGINAIWLVGVLYTLCPWELAPHLSAGWEQRLANLKQLVKRCKSHGLDVLLYLNEPHAMPHEFYEKHPELKGVYETPTRVLVQPDVVALCTSTKPVQDFIVNSVRHVFEHVPDLGGVFTIIYSEALTNCFSRKYTADGVEEELALRADASLADHSRPKVKACPRCLPRGPETVCAEVCSLIERGMRQAGSDGKFILYVWSTPDEWMPGIIEKLPASTWVQAVSEWGKTFTRGDYTGTVNEYSVSIIGPSDRSKKYWQLARKRGLKTIAKMQAANTYELNTVPYIPVMRRVAQHLANVCDAEVDGVTLGWTAGGSPSPNLDLVGEFSRKPRPSVEQAMLNVAVRRFGEAAAPQVVQAWNLLSDAFGEFPFDIDVCYNAPQCVGPANLLYARPTGYVATQVGFPYDDLDGWRGPYSADTFESQFQKLTTLWQKGVDLLDQLRQKFPSAAMEDEWRVAEACRIHFQSTVNQVRYVRGRDGNPASLVPILEDEIQITRTLIPLAGQDSRIGFETTDQYEYNRLDLAEKILNCHDLIQQARA
jgi:hypothetical protein